MKELESVESQSKEADSFSFTTLLQLDPKEADTFQKKYFQSFPAGFYSDERIVSIINAGIKNRMELDQGIIQSFIQKMALRFEVNSSDREDNLSSPVCYATSNEVTEGFRTEQFPQSFSQLDVLDYVCGILYHELEVNQQSSPHKNIFYKVSYPDSQIIFWKWVREGAQLRKQFTAQ